MLPSLSSHPLPGEYKETLRRTCSDPVDAYLDRITSEEIKTDFQPIREDDPTKKFDEIIY